MSGILTKFRIWRAPAYAIARAPMGRAVKVAGRIESENSLVAPVSAAPCLVYRVSVFCVGAEGNLMRIVDETEARPFRLRDASGSLDVDVIPCELVAPWSCSWPSWRIASGFYFSKWTTPPAPTAELTSFLERCRATGKFGQWTNSLVPIVGRVRAVEAKVARGDDVSLYGAIEEPTTLARSGPYRGASVRTIGLCDGRPVVIIQKRSSPSA